MRTSDYEANLPKRTSEELHQSDMRNIAADLINGMITGLDESKLDPTASLLWDAGGKLMFAGINTRFERLGILMMLDALAVSPEAAQQAILVLRDEYAKAHPQLPKVG